MFIYTESAADEGSKTRNLLSRHADKERNKQTRTNTEGQTKKRSEKQEDVIIIFLNILHFPELLQWKKIKYAVSARDLEVNKRWKTTSESPSAEDTKCRRHDRVAYLPCNLTPLRWRPDCANDRPFDCDSGSCSLKITPHFQSKCRNSSQRLGGNCWFRHQRVNFLDLFCGGERRILGCEFDVRLEVMLAFRK